MAGRYEVLGDDEEAGKWKQKFLESVESREQEEQRLLEQIDLLRRGLVRVSLAADGFDEQLDNNLEVLRKSLRADVRDIHLPQLLIEQLEETVLGLDKRKSGCIDNLLQVLEAICDQLLESNTPRKVKRNIKDYKESLAERVEHNKEHSKLIVELAEMQQLSLASILKDNQKGKGGWIRSLFGSEDQRAKGDLFVSDNLVQDQAAQDDIVQNNIAQNDTVQNNIAQGDAVQIDVAQDLTSQNEEPPYHVAPNYLSEDDSGDEMELETSEHIQLLEQDQDEKTENITLPVFSKVAESIVSILNNLLKQVYITDRAKEYAVQAKHRLNQGLNWYELGPLLEDISKIVILGQGDEQKELVDYLKELNEDLSEVEKFLKVSRQKQDDRKQLTEKFDHHLRMQVGELEQDVRDATDLNQLKGQINGQLERILGSLDSFSLGADKSEISLTEDLQVLLQRVEKMETESKNVNEHLEEERARALRDSLTGLPNREAYDERLVLEFARWRRYGNSLSLAICDIDLFKSVNDTYGHLAGDRVLQVIAKSISNQIRETDFVGRFGGEEFVFLFPETSLVDGKKTIEKIRQAIESKPFHFREKPVSVTVSFGLAGFRENDTSDDVFARADKALYQAKDNGRNQCVVESLEEE